MKTGLQLIAEERQEQIEKHGRTLETDIELNDMEELRIAAMALLGQDNDRVYLGKFPSMWGSNICNKMASKPYKERLIIAGALIAAEIDRINKVNPAEHQAVEDKSLYETQLCLQHLINRVRQSVNKGELVLNPLFQKAFDDGLYIIKKYSNSEDSFRVVQSEPIPTTPNKEA